MLKSLLSKFGFSNEGKSTPNTNQSKLPNNSSSTDQKITSASSRILESTQAIASRIKSGFKKAYNYTTAYAGQIYDTTCKTAKKAGNVLLNYTLDPIAKKEVFPAIGKNTEEEINIKKCLKALGAEQNKVAVGNDCEIDTMLISVKNFEQKMSEAGGKKVKLSLVENEVVDGFKIPKKSFEQIETKIEGACFFHKNKEDHRRYYRSLKERKDTGFGYITINDFVYLTSADFANRYNASKDSNKAEKLEKISDFDEGQLLTNASNTAQKTAILCNGIKGRYTNKYTLQEAAIFLLQGIDVQLFDYPEHGESTGSASHQNNYEAVHAVCEAVKKNHQENKDLILRGTCYGASLAARYAGSKDGKGSNLILHDTYHESTEMSRIYTSNQGIFANPIKDYYFEEHSLENDLKNVEGNVLVFSNLSDEYIFNHTLQDKNLDALTNGKKGRRFSCVLAGGGHAHEWYRKVNSTDYEKELLNREIYQLVLDSATEEEKKNSRIWMYKLKGIFKSHSLKTLAECASVDSLLKTIKTNNCTVEDIRICEIIFENRDKILEHANQLQQICENNQESFYGLENFKSFIKTINIEK